MENKVKRIGYLPEKEYLKLLMKYPRANL